MSDTATGRPGKAALDYHERTKHSEQRLLRERHYLDWPNQPLPFKLYRGIESVALPREPELLEAATPPALEAIARQGTQTRRAQGDAARQQPDLATLARLLYLTAGITKRKPIPGGEIYFRAYSNTGALYHLDLYLVGAELEGLSAGVYHFGPHDLALHRLRSGDYRAALVEASGRHPRLAEAPAILVSASTYWRNAWKYKERAYRHCYWDGGTMHANLLAIAGAQELEPEIVMGFADRSVEQLLGLDPQREGALTLVPLGRLPEAPPDPPAMPDLQLPTEPLSPREVDYPLIRETHAATALPSGEATREWRRAASAVRASPAHAPRGALVPLRPAPPTELPRASLARVIRRRGSTRAFDPSRSLSFEALSTVLDRATSGVCADFLASPADSLIELYLIVHAVEGLDPGTYCCLRRQDAALETLEHGDFRERAARLALFQPLAGDAAVNVYALAELAPILERFGDRGYRAAQLEGGLIGGRMYLAAYAQRFGATGLTFLDDEVTELFSPHAAGKSAMFLTALGHARRG